MTNCIGFFNLRMIVVIIESDFRAMITGIRMLILDLLC